MSRRDYRGYDDDDDSEVYRAPPSRRNRDREYDEPDFDTRSRYPETRRTETVVKERDTVVSDRRTERGARQPDFLREDYGRSSTAGPLVVREERIREEDTYSRAPTRRRSMESVRSRPPERERVEKEEIRIRETERERAPPYPRSDRGFEEKEEIIILDRERARSRPPPPRERERERPDEEIDIKIRKQRRDDSPPRSEAPPRSEYRERDNVEEIRFQRGKGERPRTTEVEKEEIRITETRRSPPPREPRVREREVEIDIREEQRPEPRSVSRGQLIGRKREEWIVRRPRSPSPPPPPPPAPRDYEKEEIIIRRKERSPSPEPLPPPREPSPPPLEPIIRPPIIQEVITHHRHIDHGIERVRSPSPPPPPPSPPREREDNLEIEIKRKGVRNGKFYEDDIIIDQERTERPSKPRERERERPREREVDFEIDRKEIRRRSLSTRPRERSPSVGSGALVTRPNRRRDDALEEEADYYNRKVSNRAYPGEAYNGATKDWALVDVPPGTERVRMDGVGGGKQEITWQRYNGERRGKFYMGGERGGVYEGEFGNGGGGGRERERDRERGEREVVEETRITESTTRGRTKDKLWTELTRDLVVREAIEECGYECEESEGFYYVMEYLRYVSWLFPSPPKPLQYPADFPWLCRRTSSNSSS